MPQDDYVPKNFDDLKVANPEEPATAAGSGSEEQKENGLFLPFNSNSTSLHLINGI